MPDMDAAGPPTEPAPVTPAETRSFRYRAFISYSHRDEPVAVWLHRAIETYVVPKSLRGMPGRDGPIPRRIMPIFRDRDELPASADLGGTLRQALEDSAVLIVLCSPDSARSHWVNEEVMEYKRLGRTNRMLAVIVRGAPRASGEEYFPPAVRYQIGADGKLTSETAHPIAPDLRPTGDGRERVKLKTIAGILGVPFDQLFSREQRRRTRRRWLTALALVVLAAAFYGTWDWQQNKLARQRQESAKRLEQAAQERARQKVHFEATAKAEEGRRALLAGDPHEAEPALAEAQARWPEEATRLMLDVARGDLAGLKSVFTGHTGGVLRLATTRDGSRVLSIGEEGTAIVWDAITGTLLRRLGNPVGQANGFDRGAFSPDGQWVVVTRNFAVGAELLNLASGQSRTFPGIAAAAFAADGRLAVTLRDFKTPGRFGWIAPDTGVETDGPVLPIPCESLETADGEGRTAVFSARVDRAWHHGWVDLATGAMIADLPDIRGNDAGPALSPDGSRLVVPTKDGFEVRSHDGVIGTLIGSQSMGANSMFTTRIAPFHVAWAARGRLLVSANQGATCSVWDADGKLLRSWSSGGIPEMEANADEALAAFTSDAGRVEVRDLDSGKILASFTDTMGRRPSRDMTSARTASVCFLPQTPLLLSAWESLEVKLWAWRDTHPAVELLQGHDAGVASITWSSDGQTLASSGQDGRALLRVVAQTGQRAEIRVSTTAGLGVAGVAFGPSNVVYTMDSVGKPGAWTAAGQPAPLVPPQPEPGILNAAQFQSSVADFKAAAGDPAAFGGLPPLVVDDKLLTAARGDREVRVRDLKTGSFGPALPTGGGRLREFTTMGNIALLADDGGTVTSVEIGTGRNVFAVKASDKPLRTVRATPGAGFATVDSDGRAAVYSLAAKPLAQVAIENVKINDAFLSAEGKSIFLACDNGKVVHRTVADGGPVEELTDSEAPNPGTMLPLPPVFGGEPKKGVLRLALSSDGRWLAASLAPGAVCLWEAGTDRLLYRFTFERADALEFSPDSHWLAAGGTSGTIALLRLKAP